MEHVITIRHSTEADRTALSRLAALDSGRTPQGDALLAYVGDDLRAAVDLRSGAVIADPFAATGEVVGLLRMRMAQEKPRRSRRGWVPRLRPRLA